MKIRTGFVSNSSSSSFVAIGFNLAGKGKPKPEKFDILELLGYNYNDEFKKYKKELKEFQLANPDYYTDNKIARFIEKAKEDPKNFMNVRFYEVIRENLDFEVLDNSEDGVNNDDFVIAYMIANMSDNEYELTKKEIPFSEITEQFRIIEDVRKKLKPGAELCLYTGTRMC